MPKQAKAAPLGSHRGTIYKQRVKLRDRLILPGSEQNRLLQLVGVMDMPPIGAQGAHLPGEYALCARLAKPAVGAT